MLLLRLLLLLLPIIVTRAFLYPRLTARPAASWPVYGTAPGLSQLNLLTCIVWPLCVKYLRDSGRNNKSYGLRYI